MEKQALVTYLSKQEIETIVDKSIYRNLQQLLQQKDLLQFQQGQPLSSKEACQLLHIRMPTLYALVSKREIPHYKKSGKLYFFFEDLTQWIKAGRIATHTEVIANAEASFLKMKQYR